ncbi:CsbD family protein [Iodobacter arcticus]|uniref:CsbD family protein n=1 Tax=Iodobacter arcticus TaxID=590593 RepID=A0ABW2QUS8_9NEIS|nr:CsbD family protein [Janthinobacterium sp. B9-8]AMC33214.1 general stress protein CsbD [Janthinobacterium sp. B9-8]
MNWDIVEGNWKQFKGKVKEQWGDLTDDHLDVIAGKRDKLAGQIQESYGITKDEAELQITKFESLNKDVPSKRLP